MASLSIKISFASDCDLFYKDIYKNDSYIWLNALKERGIKRNAGDLLSLFLSLCFFIFLFD